jgi:hypothetical protein
LFTLLISLVACRNKVDARGEKVDVGRIRLHTFPAGARVWIDGELKVEATPATLVLKEGTYQLRIQGWGAEAVERELEVEAGDVEELTLNIPKAPEARVSVISDVVGADVRINGYRRGATPLHGVITKPGMMDITVTTPDGRAKGIKGVLMIGEQKQIDVFFDEIVSLPETPEEKLLESRPPPMGFLTLGAKPDSYLFDAEEKKIGETPIENLRYPAGEHELFLRSVDGRYEKRVTIFVEPEQHAILRIQLKEEDQVPGWVPPPDAGRKK